MRKKVATLVFVLGAFFMNGVHAQDLNPNYVKQSKRIVEERTRVMELDEAQEKKLVVAVNEMLAGAQKITENHESGSKKFKEEIRPYQKTFNQALVALSTVEQRKKWEAYKKK